MLKMTRQRNLARILLFFIEQARFVYKYLGTADVQSRKYSRYYQCRHKG